MRNLLLILVSIFLLNPSTSYNACAAGKDKDNGIVFYEGSWSDVAKKAADENNLIFIDIYAIWCGPCKLLKKRTFPDAVAGAYFNSKFINATFDGEKGDGEMLATKYNIKGYPTLLILDSKGNVVSSTAGYMSPEALIEFGKGAVGK